MRDILFRAWDTVRKEYLSGGEYLLAIQKGERPKNIKTYLDVLDRPDAYKSRFIIEQFTGLTDKNNLKIFEGDIVKSIALSNDHNQRGAVVISPVEYWCGNACLSITYISIYPFCLNHEIEVIGNIHDNPELFNGGEI